MSDFKVLITTAGLGSRLGRISEFTNKSLAPVGDKPAIAHIIEQYPVDTNFVIALGHFGSHIRQFIELAYPKRNFEFVDINPYQGQGSSLASTLLQCSQVLQCPFIYNAGDSIIPEDIIPLPKFNWVAGQMGSSATNYASFDSHNGIVRTFHEKGSLEFDFVHIGIIGVRDYDLFWRACQDSIIEEPNNTQLNDVSVLKKIINQNVSVFSVETRSWLDLGNSDTLMRARTITKSKYKILPKDGESISFVNERVIKFFADSSICESRTNRAKDLFPFVPPILYKTENFYAYSFVRGEPLSDSITRELFAKLLYMLKSEFWEGRTVAEEEQFEKQCTDFYVRKTQNRLEDYLEKNLLRDEDAFVNSRKIPAVSEMLTKALPILLLDIKQVRIHGDLVLENIICNNEGEFTLIDWRDSFAGHLYVGDIYYDLAKLYHSLLVEHDAVMNDKFWVADNQGSIDCGIYVKDSRINLIEDFKIWLSQEGFNLKKVKILTSLIWLNMAPLHHKPFDMFLYNYGKLNLWNSINEQ